MAVNIADLRATLGLDASAWNRQIASVRRENVAFDRELVEVNRQIAGFQRQLRAGTNTGEAIRQIAALRARKSELRLEVDANNDALRVMARELPRVERAARNAQRQARTLGSRFRSMRTGIGLASSALAGFGAGAVLGRITRLAGAMGRLAEETSKVARNLVDQAEALGVGSQELETFQNALRLQGVESTRAERFLVTFSRRIGEFADMAEGPAASAFERLGIAQSEVANRSVIEVFDLIHQRVRDLGLEANDLAGIWDGFADVRVGSDLLPILNRNQQVWRASVETAMELTTATDATNQRLSEQRTILDEVQIKMEQDYKNAVVEYGGEWAKVRGAVNDIKTGLASFAGRELRELFGVDISEEAENLRKVNEQIAEVERRLQAGGVRGAARNPLLERRRELEAQRETLLIAGAAENAADAERTRRTRAAARAEAAAAQRAADEQLAIEERLEARRLRFSITRARRRRAEEAQNEASARLDQIIAEANAADAARRDADARLEQDQLRRLAAAKRAASEAAREQAAAEREARMEIERTHTAVIGLTDGFLRLFGVNEQLVTGLTSIGRAFQRLGDGDVFGVFRDRPATAAASAASNVVVNLQLGDAGSAQIPASALGAFARGGSGRPC